MAQDVHHAVAYGYITAGTSAHDHTGTNQYSKIGKDGDNRGYLSYDTSPIPDPAIISQVAFVSFWSSTSSKPVGAEISEYAVKIYSEHDRIGPAITTDDWTLTAYELRKNWGDTAPWPSSWTVYPKPENINKDGDTDYEIRGDSVYEDPPGGPDFREVIRIGETWHSHLDVTYTVPVGFFNRFNWRLPAIPGFGNVLAVALVERDSAVQVVQRFYPRQFPVEA